MPIPLSVEDSAHVNRICRYLARDDFDQRRPRASDIQARTGKSQFDVVAVFGNPVLATVEIACSLFADGVAARLLFSGGVGHSTGLLHENIQNSPRYGHLTRSGAITPGMSEADMMSAVATSGCAVPASAILVENRSTNTGENARFTWDLLRSNLPGVRNILIMQDPVMQRRAMLTMTQAVSGGPQEPALFSHAVFVPEVSPSGIVTPGGFAEPPPWQLARLLSLALGEMARLKNDEQGYGPRGRGFIPAEDIPAEVLASHGSLITRISAR